MNRYNRIHYVIVAMWSCDNDKKVWFYNHWTYYFEMNNCWEEEAVNYIHNEARGVKSNNREHTQRLLKGKLYYITCGIKYIRISEKFVECVYIYIVFAADIYIYMLIDLSS